VNLVQAHRNCRLLLCEGLDPGLNMAHLTIGRRISGESKIICQTDLRKMQGHQEKRIDQDHL